MKWIIMAALTTFPVIALLIAVRAMRKPDRDDYFDNPDHWGAV